MSFIQFLFQDHTFLTSLMEVIITIIGFGIAIFLEIVVAKYLIRYGVNYYYQQKNYHDNRKIIDDIEAEINVHGEG